MHSRIIGFDLARAYAIFGMYIVNFNTVFGSHTERQGLWGFLNLFNGNSSSLFVILAGMGVSLMANRSGISVEDQSAIRREIIKRSWFLFVAGLIFYTWWPADILHFYGGYMHLAVFLIFHHRKYLLYAAALAVVAFHVLFLLIPFDKGWNFDTLMYSDFWTVEGFLRNTFYNGWNPVFPWIAYFFVGMYLGRLDWKKKQMPVRVAGIGISGYLAVFLLQHFASSRVDNKDMLFYLTADYLPPFLPFMLGTLFFGLMLIGFFMLMGGWMGTTKIAQVLAGTGRMTLTHYISHLTLGFVMFSMLSGKELDYDMIHQPPVSPIAILGFASLYFIGSCLFSHWWTGKFRNGPLETLMRKVSG